jgi:serine protease Do
MRRPAASILVLAAAALSTCAPAAGAAPEQDQHARLLASKAFRAAVAKVRPSIVRIETYGGVFDPARASPQPPGRGGRPGPRPRRARAVGRPGEGPTTGLVVSPDGLILTSTFPFVREPPIITVALADGSRHVARLLGRDETRALCLLKIDDVDGLPVPQVVPRNRLRVGQWAIAVGVGYGAEQPALSAGIVSAVHRIFGRAVQTDANLSPANYGGPLVDIEGRVIGVCVPLAPMQRGGAGGGVRWYDSGIGFAVPTADLGPVIERMAQGEVIRAGRLGVRPVAVEDGAGARIQKVVEDSPAATAGLRKDDIIVAVDGGAVRDVFHLRLLVGRHVAGDEVTLTIRRGDEEMRVTATLDAGEETVPPPQPFDLGGRNRPEPPG